MKRFSIFCVALFFVAFAQAQVTDANMVAIAKPVTETLVIPITSHDFGSIPQMKPVYYSFEIRNIGSTPLRLENVQASCGCTTPEWNRDPIPVNGTAVIRVGYNAASEGPFEKPITITYNGNQSKQITIKGTVWRAPASSAPVNQSIQFLKQQMQ